MANSNEQKGAPIAEEALNKSEDFFLKNKKTIIGAVIAVVAIIVAWVCYDMLIAKPNLEKGRDAIAVGQRYFDNDQMELAVNGDSTDFKGFAALAQEYSGKNANLANLYNGLAYAQLGKWEQAVEYLEKYKDSGDNMVSPAAEGALGNAYAYLKKYDEAVKHLLKAAERADNISLSPNFYIQAGEILESQKKNAEALEAYQKAKEYIDRMPQQLQMQLSSMGVNIDGYIERVK